MANSPQVHPLLTGQTLHRPPKCSSKSLVLISPAPCCKMFQPRSSSTATIPPQSPPPNLSRSRLQPRPSIKPTNSRTNSAKSAVLPSFNNSSSNSNSSWQKEMHNNKCNRIRNRARVEKVVHGNRDQTLRVSCRQNTLLQWWLRHRAWQRGKIHLQLF